MKKSFKILLAILTISTLTVTVIPAILNGTPASPAVGNWYQQYMPNLGGRQINDITFTDSLNGFAITNKVSDTSFVLRTTNGGDSWTISHFDNGICSYYSVQFLNTNTGFVSGYIYNGSNYRILKTSNGGNTWVYVDHTSDIVAIDMHVLSVDTIWLVDSGSLTGGVFRTTNGGSSWEQQLNLSSLNPNRIYMYNARIGYITEEGGGTRYVRKTTDGGVSWTEIVINDDFRKIFFTDSLTGWKCSVFGMKKTTNGGLNWVTQIIPFGGIIVNSFIFDFSVLNKDTLWGTGGYVLYPNSQTRGILYRTTNGGNDWLFQIPDTSINMSYSFVRFTDKLHGWVYSNGPTGIHTRFGGDTGFIVGIHQISSEIPMEFRLYQNYPNPFNPKTNIKYSVKGETSNVRLIVFDIQGKQVSVILNQKQSPGTYEVDWNAAGYSSGIYFYSLITDGFLIETKKMILIK